MWRRLATEVKLTFGNDADDMRSALWGIDPRTNVGDLSSDLVGWAEQQIEIVSSLEDKLMDIFRKEGSSWEGVRRGYYIARWLKVGALLRLPPLVVFASCSPLPFSLASAPYPPLRSPSPSSSSPSLS